MLSSAACAARVALIRAISSGIVPRESSSMLSRSAPTQNAPKLLRLSARVKILNTAVLVQCAAGGTGSRHFPSYVCSPLPFYFLSSFPTQRSPNVFMSGLFSLCISPSLSSFLSGRSDCISWAPCLVTPSRLRLASATRSCTRVCLMSSCASCPAGPSHEQ
jgi:hypothetical protein